MASDGNTTRLTLRGIEEMIARGGDQTNWTKVDSISYQDGQELEAWRLYAEETERPTRYEQVP
jgi:hypothetical protein